MHPSLTVSKSRGDDRRTAILLLATTVILTTAHSASASPLRERCAVFVPTLGVGLDLRAGHIADGPELRTAHSLTGWVKLSWPLDRPDALLSARIRASERARREALRARIDALTQRRDTTRDPLDAEEAQAELDALAGSLP